MVLRAVLTSRFVPGMRMPLYIAAGAAGGEMTGKRFALWTAFAVCIWVPLIVGMALLFGKMVGEVLHERWWLFLIAVFVLLHGIRFGLAMTTASGRRRISIKLRRWGHHEWWPTWAMYLNMLPFFALLALRYRSLSIWTLANPCLPEGGVIGESKDQILNMLPEANRLRHFPIAELDKREGSEVRMAQVKAEMARRGWDWPVIIKPDEGQRGRGIAKVEDEQELAEALDLRPGTLICQQYHPGPHEVGIFYIKEPGQAAGRIFSITWKVFPIITGDGVQTIEQLIVRHPRYRMQQDTFLHRLGTQADEVLPDGQAMRLAEAGNHAQGTRFEDGAHLITPELEAAVDRMLSQIEGGFEFGRLDVRFADLDAFKRGEDMAVIELNGVTSESTNIYDPNWSLWQARHTFMRQWEALAKIGAAHRAAGRKPRSLLKIAFDAWRWAKKQRVPPVAD